MKRIILIILALIVALLGALFIRDTLTDRQTLRSTGRMVQLGRWFNEPSRYPEWQINVGTRCGNAPMLMPTNGYIGFGWDDSFRPGHRHSGLDIFSPDGENNATPIVAAYDGYLTREGGWKSTVAIRHPDFPALPETNVDPDTPSPEPGEQIWTYYTHMASRDGEISYVDEAFPPGTYEQFVEAGTLLGRQGNWSGNPVRPTGLHLHFSVIKSKADGGYRDEREIDNTYETTQFLGLTQNEDGIWGCER